MSTNSYVSVEEQGAGKEAGHKGEKDDDKPKKEPPFFTLTNPARLTVAQSRFVTLQAPSLQRYTAYPPVSCPPLPLSLPLSLSLPQGPCPA